MIESGVIKTDGPGSKAALVYGQRSFVFKGPLWSIGSPITFIILPSVSGPTGTVIAFPVLITLSPLFLAYLYTEEHFRYFLKEY